MDAQTRAFLDQIAAENPPSWQELGAAKARRIFQGFGDVFGTPGDVFNCENHTFSGVPVRVYTPADEGPHAALAYFHGGGWVLGDLDTHEALCRQLCQRTGAVVMAVDYRRAPEHKFPAAIDDCYNAVAHWVASADAFDIDPSRLVVAGDSAGGNLAAALAIKARDGRGPDIRYQVLLYPAIEPNYSTTSYDKFATGHGLTKAAMQWFWECYLASEDDAYSPLAVPIVATDLADLPSALIVTAQYDVLCDEGHKYAAALMAANVNVTHLHVEGVIHGFIHMHGLFDRGQQAIKEVATIIREAVA